MGRKIKPTIDTQKNSERVLRGIQGLIIPFRGIPSDIRAGWSKYWSGYGDSTPDYEPRVWGNDCFEGDPSNYGH